MIVVMESPSSNSMRDAYHIAVNTIFELIEA
jgi:hypothetical protein